MSLLPAKNLSARNAGPTLSLLAPVGLSLAPSDDSLVSGKAMSAMFAPVRPLLLLLAPLPALPMTVPLTLLSRAELITWMPFWGSKGAHSAQEQVVVSLNLHQEHADL